MQTIQIKSDCLQTVLKDCKKARLSNEGKWIQLSIEYKGKSIQVKSFDKSIQIIQGDGIRDTGGWDMTATQWQETIAKWLVRF
jgi:hypothetical protein